MQNKANRRPWAGNPKHEILNPKLDESKSMILENKANLAKPKMNASSVATKDYEKRCTFRVEQKQSQSKPICMVF
jgi:hypothetical protein